MNTRMASNGSEVAALQRHLYGAPPDVRKERSFLNPIHNPKPFIFPFLKIGLTRHGPCENGSVTEGKVQLIDYQGAVPVWP